VVERAAGPAVVLFVEFAGSRGALRYGVSFAKRRSQQHWHGTAKASPSTTCSKAAAEGSILAISPIGRRMPRANTAYGIAAVQESESESDVVDGARSQQRGTLG